MPPGAHLQHSRQLCTALSCDIQGFQGGEVPGIRQADVAADVLPGDISAVGAVDEPIVPAVMQCRQWAWGTQKQEMQRTPTKQRRMM